MVIALCHPTHPHPIPEGLLTPFTIVSRFLQENFTFFGGDTNKALVPFHVSSLCVSVNNSILLPLSKALVLPLLEHLGPVEAVEDGVEHDLRVITVRI